MIVDELYLSTFFCVYFEEELLRNGLIVNCYLMPIIKSHLDVYT